VKPVVCLITDRRRFGPSWETALVERVRAAARAGVHLVQIRERDLDGGPLTRLVSSCVEAVRGTRTRVLVNDRLDVALAVGADGVQLGHSSLDVEEARRLNVGWWIGKSVHDLAEAEAARASGADYLVVGPVFPTPTHPGREPLGPARLGAIARLGIPTIAVGGVTAERVPELRDAGAHGIAAIRALWDAADPAAAARQMLEELTG